MESEELDSQLYSKLQSIIQNSGPEATQAGVSVLVKLLQNINEHPEEAKYRSIKKSNKVIGQKLLSLPGILEILQLIGYQDSASDSLEFTHSLEILETVIPIVEVIHSELAEMLKTDADRERERREKAIKDELRSKEEAKKRLIAQSKLDRQETNTKLIPTQDSIATQRGLGKQSTFKDIGVDINKKGG